MQVFIDLIELGFPIAASIVCGYFIYLTLQFILKGVTSSIFSMKNIIKRLDSRIDVMNDDLQKVDLKIDSIINLDSDYSRISRTNSADIRRD